MSRYHSHWCDCGAFFVCGMDPDKCAVPDPYVCPNCEQQQLDDWLSTQPAPNRLTEEHSDESDRHLSEQVSARR